MKIGVTMGDPGGIGPEVAIRALAGLPGEMLGRVVLFGDRVVLNRSGGLGLLERLSDFICPEGLEGKKYPVGSVNPVCGLASLKYLEQATARLRAGDISALVTAPVSKEAITRAGVKFHGQTEYLSEKLGADETAMIFFGGRLRLLLLTRHLPLAKVPGALSPALVESQVRLAHDFLVRRVRVARPSILLCGLNPHAGEGGLLGDEERGVFYPAIEALRTSGLDVSGPVAADSAYRVYRENKHHLLVSAYHDQLLPLFKALYFNRGINVTAGLPAVRTSPAHGTAFQIAGKGVADPGGMRQAIISAFRFAKCSRAG